jgi:hypothetical protein
MDAWYRSQLKHTQTGDSLRAPRCENGRREMKRSAILVRRIAQELKESRNGISLKRIPGFRSAWTPYFLRCNEASDCSTFYRKSVFYSNAEMLSSQECGCLCTSTKKSAFDLKISATRKTPALSILFDSGRETFSHCRCFTTREQCVDGQRNVACNAWNPRKLRRLEANLQRENRLKKLI